MNNTSNRSFSFETDRAIDIPMTGANGAFGIRFRLTRTLWYSPIQAEKTLVGAPDYENFAAWEPSFAVTGRRVGWHEAGWDDLRMIQTSLDCRWAQPGNKESAKKVSAEPVLRSGQLYELRFPDGTGKMTLITLSDGTVVDEIDMAQFGWNLTGGFFPDHKITLCIGDEFRSSVTISDLEFIVPPAVP